MATGVYEQDERGDYEPEDKSHREPARVPHNRSLIVAICVTTALTLCFLFYLWGTAPSAEALKETTTPSTERYYVGNGGASGTSGHATNKHTAHPATPFEDLLPSASAAIAVPDRPVPVESLVCTFGPDIKASTVYPEDGLCDYSFLEEMPVSRVEDLSGPYAPQVQHFFNMAEKHRKTEYGVAFDSEEKDLMMEIVKNASSKSHFENLFSRRIFHYGYLNTDPYLSDATSMAELLGILKDIKNFLAEKRTPERPIYTVIASTWSSKYDIISATDAAAAFRNVMVPDIYISKAHFVENDSRFNACVIVPPTFLEPPDIEESKGVYFYSLVTALKHASDMDKLRHQGVGAAALYLSVGVYGRWYFDPTDPKGNVEADTVGTLCQPKKIIEQMASVAEACAEPKYKPLHESKRIDCKYVVDNETNRRFVFDSANTLQRKLCTSKRNVTGLQFGIAAARVEFSDSEGLCSKNKFPLLSMLKKLVNFFKDEYKSAADFENCLT
ncbi:uncharacterized protein LOC144097460 [Amblyomma americanum]